VKNYKFPEQVNHVIIDFTDALISSVNTLNVAIPFKTDVEATNEFRFEGDVDGA